jgi:hypothetical protein
MTVYESRLACAKAFSIIVIIRRKRLGVFSIRKVSDQHCNERETMIYTFNAAIVIYALVPNRSRASAHQNRQYEQQQRVFRQT